MGRPHLEPLVDSDVRQKAFGMPGWKSGIRVRTLSIDPVNGACTQIAEIPGGFRQPGGFSTTEWEAYVLDGSLTIGDQTCGPHHYLFVPAGYHLGDIATRQGCKLIWFFNDHYPDWVKADGHRDRQAAAKRFTSVNTNDTIRWSTPNFFPQTEPGIFIKMLAFEERTGACTCLYNMCAGFWQDNVSFHDCVEEMYHIWGESWMLQFGYLPTGGYVYRPPYVNHGPFSCEYGTLGIFRTDSWLVNHFNFNPFKNPDECRIDVIDKIRTRQPNLWQWVWMHKDEFVP